LVWLFSCNPKAVGIFSPVWYNNLILFKKNI
jgi:hypothetical protein